MTRLIIVMGVSGCGKSTIGKLLATELGCDFVDGDDLHPAENVARMRSGKSLNDELRIPWLSAICQLTETYFERRESIVIACSALKAKYREQLRSVSRPVEFVFLEGERELIMKRLANREGHYMPATLLDSQFEDLEDPRLESDVIAISVDQTAKEICRLAVERLKEDGLS